MSAIKCRALTDAEVIAVATELNLRDKCLFLLGCYTGFRIAELCSIYVKDVAQFGGILTHVTVQKRFMKGNKASRRVPINPIVRPYLLELIQSKGLEEKEALFQSREGGGVSENQVRFIMRNVFNKLRMTGNLSTHSMRKTFAQKIWIASGKDLRLTQLALGHKSIDSTTKYLDIGETEVEEYFNKTMYPVMNAK